MAVIAYQYRGDLVDQIHRGHIAVTDHTGRILWKLGDPERLTFARSSAKPLQAIPVAESGALEHYGITPQELAVICSSHNGEPFHVKAVESILHKAGLSPDQLCCGSEYPMYVPAEDALKIAGIPRAPIYCDCSGKHAGMLITARHLGESLEGYTALEHPVQQRILSVFAEMCGVETSDVQLAVDGCGVPVHALPLYRLAQGYARMSLPTLFAPTRAATLRRITSAMTAHPEMVAGTSAARRASVNRGRSILRPFFGTVTKKPSSFPCSSRQAPSTAAISSCSASSAAFSCKAASSAVHGGVRDVSRNQLRRRLQPFSRKWPLCPAS